MTQVFIGIFVGLMVFLLFGIGYWFIHNQKYTINNHKENITEKSITDDQEAIQKSYENRQERIEALKKVGKELSGN